MYDIPIESIVEEFEKVAGVKKDVALGALMAATGGLVLASPRAQNQLVGLRRVFHGTNPTNIDAIRESGLLSSKGGTGAAQVHHETIGTKVEGAKDYRESSKRLVHVTPVKGVARGYAAFHIAPLGESGKQRSRAMSLATVLPGLGEKGVITADIPREVYNKFEKDPDSSLVTIPTPALRGHVDVESKYIKGSKGYNRLKLLKDQAKDIKRYAVEDPKGFMLGVGTMAAGTALAALGGKKVLKGISKIGAVVDLNDQASMKKFKSFAKRKDVYGHRTPHAESVLDGGKIISAMEALRRGKIKSVEIGRGVGNRKSLDLSNKLSKDHLNKLQNALLVSPGKVDDDALTDVAVDAGVEYHQMMGEFLKRRHGAVKRHLGELGDGAEKFRRKHLSIPKLGPNIFVTKGGVMNEPRYGDVSMLVMSRSAKKSPFANVLTNEHIIEARKPMDPRSINVRSGFVIAPSKRVDELNKKYPDYQFVREEQIPDSMKKDIYLPTRSAREITTRVLPALFKGELRLTNW